MVTKLAPIPSYLAANCLRKTTALAKRCKRETFQREEKLLKASHSGLEINLSKS